MNRLKTISKYKQTIGICFGIIAAIAILVSQSCYYNYLAKEEARVKTEVADEEGDDNHDVLTISKDAVTSAVQFTISQVLHFIAEIHQENGADIEVKDDRVVEFNSLFKTLFRLIIAPNAP